MPTNEQQDPIHGPLDAERILHDAIVRVMSQLDILTPLRALYDKGHLAARESLQVEMARNLRWGLSRPEIAEWRGAPAGGVPESEVVQLSAASAHRSVATALNTIRATEVVFYHACVDGAATDCCRAVILLRADGCWPEIGGEEVALNHIKDKGLEVMVAEARERLARRLSNRSLPNRADWIHKHCPPMTGGPPILPDYEFDRDRLRRLDGMRNQVVHGVGVSAAAGLDDGDGVFLVMTGIYLARLVMTAHKIPLDSAYTSEQLKKRR